MPILVKIQKNVDSGPTIILLSPSDHAEAGTGYPLRFAGLQFTAVPPSSLRIAGQHGLKIKDPVWTGNRGGALPDGLEPGRPFLVRSISDDRSLIELSAVADSKPVVFATAGVGTHYLLTWPDAAPFWKLGQAMYSPQTIEDAGDLIARALDVHPAVQQAFDQAFSATTRPQPIYLELGPDEADSLPWETLYRQNTGFVALAEEWPIARMTRQPACESDFAYPLKIMAVLSTPGPGETASGEWKSIYQELEASGVPYELWVFVSEKQLLESIKDLNNVKAFELIDDDQILTTIREVQPDLLHFFCHGSAEKSVNLILYAAFDVECGLKPSIQIDANKLISYVSPVSPPWLLTLNCCDTAAGTSTETLNLANTLARKGFPAVIGMRRKVKSDYASHFSRYLYRSVLETIRDPDKTEVEWVFVLSRVRVELASKYATEVGAPGYADAARYSNEWTLPVLYTAKGPHRLHRFAQLLKRRKATRQGLVRFMAFFRARDDNESRKFADQIELEIQKVDAEIAAEGPP